MKVGFLDKLIGRLDRLDPKSFQTHFLRLAKEKGLLETIFQSIQEGVIVLDGEGRISYANRAAEQFMGFTLEATRLRPIGRFMREVDWSRILNLDAGEWAKLVSHEVEVTYPEHRFLNFYVVPLSTVNPDEKGAVVILRDVTRDRERAATQIESERLDAITLLAAGVAHEIGNPLNALNIHLQLFDREIQHLPEKRRRALRELVDVARSEVERLDTILSEFLKAVRPTRPRLAPARVESVLKDTLAVLKQEIEDRNIRVEIDCAEPLPRIQMDRNQIKQAFFNVIKNAVQAMAGGCALGISVWSTDRLVGISFQDMGHGIGPSEFGRIFEPYYTTKPDGSGLGLMIVQRIVQDHGGRIDVRSAPGVGTTFTILLPLAERRVRLLKAARAETRDEKGNA